MEHLIAKSNKLFKNQPYDADAMNEIKQNIKKQLKCSDQSDVHVNVDDVQKEIQTLKAGKRY